MGHRTPIRVPVRPLPSQTRGETGTGQRAETGTGQRGETGTGQRGETGTTDPAALSPGDRPRYLAILMIRSMPSRVWSRPSWVCMKHTST
jgi:hypothetical protein